MTQFTTAQTLEQDTLTVEPPRHRGVYLLHFDEPISPFHTTRHYIGFADNVASRIESHINGNSKAARLTQVAKERGINFRLVRVWEYQRRDFERKLKNRKNAPKFCPCCNPESWHKNGVAPDLF